MKEWRKRVYQQATGKRRKSKNWLRIRKRVVERDRFQCQMCKKFYGEGNLILNAHHIKPRSKGGTNRLTNLITLCIKCHDIAEMGQLKKCEILNYYENIKGNPQMEGQRWQQWVYGGCRKPRY